MHRDVSPQNILVSYEGAVKITDFGIAKAEDRASKTQAGVLKGKFGYMSPEQVRGLEIDHRSDIFAVGILLYEMVTGKRLFIGESDFSTLERVRKAEIIPPTEHNPDLSPEFEQVVLRTLARERDERYQWASELFDDLQQFLIEANTIYNAKRLSALLADDYQSDIDAEMQRMEEYMRLPPPSASQVNESPLEVPDINVKPADKGESTMIFESDFADLENAPTQIGESVSEGQLSRIEQMQTGSLVVPAANAPPPPSPAVQSRPQTAPPRRATGTTPPKNMLPVAALAVMAVVFIGLVGVLAYTLFAGGDSTGSLTVTTRPETDDIQILLNGEVVSTYSPFFREGLEEGEYRLEARATGWEPMVYGVQILSGDDTMVEVEFDTIVARTDGRADIETVPDGASVFVDGKKVGITPYELTGLNTEDTVEVEVRLDGFKSKKLSGDFPVGKGVLVLSAELEEDKAFGTLTINSVPSSASLYLNERRIGVTPFEIEELDLDEVHRIEVTKDGYKPSKFDHKFNGERSVTKTVSLTALSRRSPTSRTPKPPKPSGGGNSGGSTSSQSAAAKAITTPKPSGGGSSKTPKAGKCSGRDGTFSVMVLGEPSCTIKVGGKTSYKSPMFQQRVPVGRCPVVVSCPSGKSFNTVRTLKNGDNGKLIVKPNMLK
ncbi:MAG: serine/threonine-protein kinase, partial [Myxococcota bacterium]